ncbi:MAG: hypothetical protein LAQ69_04390 [Acidobacteriia bacterium]|nr:hypothetical protein [Terriglobia bacterium]
MNLRNLIFTTACGLAFSAGLRADGVCKSFMASGTYLMTSTGWVSVNPPNPLPVAPTMALGVINIDENGVISSAAGSVTAVTAGMTQPPDAITGKLIVNPDCTATFKATCTNGCSWEGAGLFLKNSKEAHLVFTKTNGYPVTAFLDLKQISN